MTQRLSRRFFLTSAFASGLAAAGQGALAGAPLTSLHPVARGEDIRRLGQTSAETLIAKAKLNGEVGFSVMDVSSGLVLEEHHAEAGLPPASVAKALTASYALETLGPDHRFSTTLIATGGVSEGIVAGDLVLNGGGDPTLDTDGLATLAADLAGAGIREVRGRFLVCGGALPYTSRIDPDQPEHVGYNPAVSGLNLNFNRVHFEWHQGGNGYDVSMDARSNTLRPAVRMAQMAVVARDAPIYTYADANGRDEWTVARAALGKEGARWLPVRKPELYAGEVFQSLAAAKGLTLRAPEVVMQCPEGAMLAQVQSAPLHEVLREMLKYSTNLTAELVGLSATAKRIGHTESIRASAAEMSSWAKVEMGLNHVAMVDHSGLSDLSRVAAADMARALVSVRKRLDLKPLLKEIPMRDAKRRIDKSHPLTVHAKTGTLNFVSGLAGYIDGSDGTELAFAIFSGDLDHRATLTLAERERPPGGASWNTRAKILQQNLIDRWGAIYAS